MKKQDRQQFGQLADELIIERIVSQKQTELFEVLYDRYAPKIYYKCLGLTSNEETAKDLMHEVMIKVFLNIAKFQGKSKFSLWVHSISYNHCMQYFRLQKRLQMQSQDILQYENVSIEDIENSEATLKEIQVQQLERFMKKLAEEYRLILSMRYYADMSIKQIAVTLQMGESAVKMRLKRGRDQLAKLFKVAQSNA